MYENQRAADSATQMYNAMPPAVKAVADEINNGTLSYKEFRKTRGGLNVDQADEINQWKVINDKIAGFSDVLKTGQGVVQTYQQALAILVGGQDNLRTALELTGNNAAQTNDAIKQISDTSTDASGAVKGYTETMGTLNAENEPNEGLVRCRRNRTRNHLEFPS